MTVADFAEWIANGRPPWAAYPVFMSAQFITIDKHPGFRPVGVGETWRRLMAKCVLWVTSQEAKDACGTEQMVGGVEAGIEGGGTCYAPPIGISLPGGIIDVSPH